jgi:hypothetical protein
MNCKPPLRVRSLVIQALKTTSVNHLADLINAANEDSGTGCRVSRQLVTNLRDSPESISLTWDHLVAFHTYFKENGASLQHLPILETRGVFEALGDKQRLVFMYGARSRPEEQRTDNSHWDTRAHVELVRQASLTGRPLEFDAQDVLWRCPVDPATLGSEPWRRILDEDQASVVSLGSPLSALSSEIMLASMLDVKSFEPPHVMQRRLPFYFVWLHRVAAEFRSAFGLTADALRAKHPDLARRVQRNATTAVFLGETVLESPTKGHDWTMHGIIAAQRRAAGNVWLVVAGLHGPATFGAATMVKDITDELPWSSKGPSKVLWVPVKVRVRAGKAKPTDGDIREVVGAEFDGKPRIWPDEK